jgi:hypothetical protein
VKHILSGESGKAKPPVAKKSGGGIGTSSMKHAAPDEREMPATEGKAPERRYAKGGRVRWWSRSSTTSIFTFIRGCLPAQGWPPDRW